MKKILLVDDEPDIVEFLKYNLEQQNFEVIVGHNGEEALKKLVEKPDLILLDIMMPKLDGFETCKRIREKREFENVPIIFLTAKSGEIDEYIITDFALLQNYPNPFNPSTSIQYAISSRQFVTLKVFDVLGKEVATLVNEEKSAGSYDIEFNASQLASGVYIYKIQAGDFVQTKKMILMK